MFVMQAIKLNNAKETKFIYHNDKRCSMYLYQLNCGLVQKTTPISNKNIKCPPVIPISSKSLFRHQDKKSEELVSCNFIESIAS